MRRIAVCSLGFAIVGALACSDPEVTDPCGGVECVPLQIDGAALFAEACSGCHSLEGPIAASASVSDPHEAWALVRKCVEQGLRLTEDEEAAIFKYLLESANN